MKKTKKLKKITDKLIRRAKSAIQKRAIKRAERLGASPAEIKVRKSRRTF